MIDTQQERIGYVPSTPKTWADLTEDQLKQLHGLLHGMYRSDPRTKVNTREKGDIIITVICKVSGRALRTTLLTTSGSIITYSDGRQWSQENLWQAFALLLSWGVDYRPAPPLDSELPG